MAAQRPEAGSGNGSRWLAFIGSAIVTLLVFAWIGKDISPIDVYDALSGIAPPEILLFLVSSLFMSICRTWRFLLLLEPVGYRPGRVAMFLTVLVRNLFADLLPARIGSLIYLWLCRTRLGVSWGAASSSMAISFVFDMIAVAPLLIVVGLVIAGELGFSRIAVWAFGLAVAGGALTGPLPAGPVGRSGRPADSAAASLAREGKGRSGGICRLGSRRCADHQPGRDLSAGGGPFRPCPSCQIHRHVLSSAGNPRSDGIRYCRTAAAPGSGGADRPRDSPPPCRSAASGASAPTKGPGPSPFISSGCRNSSPSSPASPITSLPRSTGRASA